LAGVGLIVNSKKKKVLRVKICLAMAHKRTHIGPVTDNTTHTMTTPHTTTTDTTGSGDEKHRIVYALIEWVHQRPGLDRRNYGSESNYRSELRSINRQREDFSALVPYAAELTCEELKEGFRAYSGRLSWDGERLDYCCGQYWPTEYRAAACAVLAAALWDHYRDDIPADVERKGDAIRAKFRRMFGNRLASTWFN
jgi:hypothetical protein